MVRAEEVGLRRQDELPDASKRVRKYLGLAGVTRPQLFEPSASRIALRVSPPVRTGPSFAVFTGDQ